MKEQAYLRSELNSRIILTYTHSHTTMTFVITIWSILITLISFFYTNFADHYEIISIIAPLLVLITMDMQDNKEYAHNKENGDRRKLKSAVALDTFPAL